MNQFFIKLIKPLPGWRLVSQENWFESLAKEYKKRDLKVDFPVPSTSSTILTISLLKRLEILRNLCEFHLEQPEHFWELLRVKDGETNWRIEPIGKDSQNRRYWLFSDARLYREIEGLKIVKKKKKKLENENLSWDIENENNWELVCLTRTDYDELLISLKEEKSLLKLMRDEIIPKVEPILNFQLSQHKKYFRPVASERIFLLPRKRSSRILEKELEEEQRRFEREEAEKEFENQRQAIKREQTQTTDLFTLKLNEKDLVEEREIRAEMRRLKKEKEMQIKEIEEAFYSNFIKDENVEIISEDDDEKPQIPTVQVPKSPIKLVFKVTKPEEKLTEIKEDIKEDIVDIVDIDVTEDIKEEIDATNVTETEIKKHVNSNDLNVTEDINNVVIEDNENITEAIANTVGYISSTVGDISSTVGDITETTVDDIQEHSSEIDHIVKSSEIGNVSYEDADLLNSLSNN